MSTEPQIRSEDTESFVANAPRPASSGTRDVIRDAIRAACILAAVAVIAAAAYLAFTIPGAWFPSATQKTWRAADMALVRGTGRLANGQLIVSAPDANGIAIVTVTTDLKATEYPGIAWDVANLREDADVRLLWRTDFQPDKLNSKPLPVESGRTLPVVMSKDAAWIGHISGLALAIHGSLSQPAVIGGVAAKPMGAMEIIRDRWREWFTFEPWNGASINTITGGADNQALDLPAVVALLVAASGLVAFVVRRFNTGTFSTAAPLVLAGLFLAGWFVLDARWSLNLLRQEHATAVQYAGKDDRDKHLASEDAPLFAFIEKALALMPRTPVRIFIAADADYFRGRAAYHLYPHNVYFNPRSNDLPPASAFRPGDWLLVFQRHGMQYDRAQGKVRWDDNQTVSAEPKLVVPGAALFVIR
jgi:hypothetical protein